MAVNLDALGLDGPVGERVQWLLRQVASSPPATTAEEAAAMVEGDDPLGFLQWLSGEIGGGRVERVEAPSAYEATLRVVSPNGRLWDLTVVVEPRMPNRIQNARLDRALPDGMEVREATPADGEAIGHVCRNTTIVLRDSSVTIDPGSDYFAGIRLMARPTVLVATDHGRVVGVHCGVHYPITYGGELQYMSQILHSRVLKDYAGLGLWSVMNRTLVNATNARRETVAQTEGAEYINGCGYFAVDNDTARRLNGAQHAWSFKPWRAVLPCTDLAHHDGAGIRNRVAEKSDADQIVSIINECHLGEELFRPYTVEALTTRLERAPDVYSWSNLLLSKNAVVGTWPAGRTHTRRRAVAGLTEETVSVRALVLDYGFRAGAEDELVALLGRTARAARDLGMTDLAIFSSDPSPGSTLLRGLAADIEEYELSTPYTPEPEGAAERGIYVDQIYF